MPDQPIDRATQKIQNDRFSAVQNEEGAVIFDG